jgi:hypothetical protein
VIIQTPPMTNEDLSKAIDWMKSREMKVSVHYSDFSLVLNWDISESDAPIFILKFGGKVKSSFVGTAKQ